VAGIVPVKVSPILSMTDGLTLIVCQSMMSLGARLVCQIETDADASRKKQEQQQGQLIVGYESHGVEFTGGARRQHASQRCRTR